MRGIRAICSVFRRITPTHRLQLALSVLLGIAYIGAYRAFNAHPRHFVLEARLSLQTARPLPCEFDLSDPTSTALAKMRGWSYAEEWGSWTDGDDAYFGVRFEPRFSGQRVTVDFDLSHQMLGAPGQTRPISVDVFANGCRLATWSFNHSTVTTLRTDFLLPTTNPQAILLFRIRKPLSPLAVGVSADARQLGIGIDRIRFLPTNPPSR